jgi:predicted lysophospholipase L1 biosynthesis ABC-type transport system permease subunit
MSDKEYIEQLRDIKNIMDKSTKFLSLSGLSGILAGVYALAGACVVQFLINRDTYPYVTLYSNTFKAIVAIAAGVLVLSVITALVLSKLKAQKRNEKVWGSASKRLLLNFSIPLLTGAVFGISLLKNGHYGLIAPVTLIFYGLALLQASKYTLETVRSLGVLFIVLGLINCWYVGYGLYFWAMGFGIFHIVYGSVMYFKFDRKSN